MKSSIVEAIELPDIIKLEENMFGVVFDLMKLLPARHMINEAKRQGLINKDTTIIETSSGTFALGLSMVCNLYGYKLIIVSDPVIDDSLKRRLEDLGTQVEIVTKVDRKYGFQGSRLRRVKQLLQQNQNSFWTNQYDNINNADAYVDVAEKIVEEVGRVETIIGSVGSGGSMTGISKYLKAVFPKLYVIGVDTNGSVLFGQENKCRALRGLGNSIIPQNLDHSIFDEIHWLEAEQAYRETRNLHKKHSLFMGGTSGAAYSIAKWYLRKNPTQKVVVLFPDQGYRYQDTIYNDLWLEKNNLLNKHIEEAPGLVLTPIEAQKKGGWNRFLWNNRSYKEVTESTTLNKKEGNIK